MNRANRAFLLFLASAWISSPARAQGLGDCEFLDEGDALVQGQLLVTSDDLPFQRGITPTDSRTQHSCLGLADATGRFRFAGVPQGDYALGVGSLGIQRIGPLPFSLAPGEVAEFRIPLLPEDRISDCLRIPECAGVLTRLTPTEAKGVSELALRAATLRLAVAVSWTARSESDSTIFCLPPDHPASAELIRISPRMVAASECGLPSPADREREGRRPTLRHLSTGVEAVGVWVGEPSSVSGEVVDVSVGFHVGPLWAASFRCRLESKEGTWVPISCRLTEIS